MPLLCRFMFLLQNISLYQFKNYDLKAFSFKEKVIAICGPNGSGKTNLLDAIYYLCFTRSYFNRQDAQIVKHGLPGLRLDGLFLKKDETYKVTGIIRENNRKEFLIDQSEYKKFSEHIGRFPCVMIAPDDVSLITGSGEERRKFLDTLLSQINSAYLQCLIDYNKILLQRNSLLKQMQEQHQKADLLLDTLDEQLADKGTFIFNWRKEFIADFLPKVKEAYQQIAGKSDQIELIYESQLFNQPLSVLLQLNRHRDLITQRTSAGIHKDDIQISMKDLFFKTIASQGQRKSMLFSLKLAEFTILKDQKGFSPILLMDDVFEKLDAERMHHLLFKVCVEENAQVFISDTHAERLSEHLAQLNITYQLIQLSAMD